MESIERVKYLELNMTSRFIDPLFLNQMRSNRETTSVQEDGTISLFGEKLVFADETAALEPGTEVLVCLGTRTLSCAPIAAIEVHNTRARAAELAEKEKERVQRNAHRDKSIAFNASLPIHVEWCPGIKDVLSGLSEKSDGTGMMKSTVEHVFLLGDLNVGRLKRSEGDFLCGNSKSKWGARYSDPRSLAVDGDGSTYAPKVTCKACLAIIERMAKVAAKGK